MSALRTACRQWGEGTSPVVRCLRLCPPKAGAPVRSLVRELDRSHILQPRLSASKNKKGGQGLWAYPKRARRKTWTSLHHFVPWFSGRSFKVWATGTVCARGGEARGCGVNIRMEGLSSPLCRPSPPPAHPPHQLGTWSLGVSLGTICWGGGSTGRDRARAAAAQL